MPTEENFESYLKLKGLSSLSIKKYMYLYIGVVALQFIFPSVYVLLFENLVRVIKITELGGVRGVSALTSEPSFTALILFTFILVARYTDSIKGRPHTWIMIAMLGFGILTTKAVTGYVFLFAFLGYEALKKVNISTAILIAGITAIFMALNFDDSRGIQFIVRAIQSPENILYESSLFYRVYYLTLGFVSLNYNPVGMILGSVDVDAIKHTADSIFIGHTFPHLFAKLTPGINIPTSLGMGLMVYGVFYLIFYLLVFMPVYVQRNVPFIVKVLIFAFTAQSFSFAFPILWFLVGMSERSLWGVAPKTKKGSDND